MSTVMDLLSGKGFQIFSVVPGANVLEAVDKMILHRVGALLVMDEGVMHGMFTERDVLKRVVADQKNPADMTVEEVMTRDVLTCSPDIDIEEAGRLMTEHRIRHLPVVDDQDHTLLGMISIGDINKHYSSRQEQRIMFLEEYLYGRA